MQSMGREAELEVKKETIYFLTRPKKLKEEKGGEAGAEK